MSLPIVILIYSIVTNFPVHTHSKILISLGCLISIIMADGITVKVFIILLCFCQIHVAAAQNQQSTSDGDPGDEELGTTEATVKFTEIDVWGLRLWQVAGMFLAGITGIIILACCFCDIRIPRTKKEIEARYKKKIVVEKYADDMNTVYVRDLPPPPPETAEVLQEVRQVTPKKEKRVTRTPKKEKRGKKKGNLLKKLGHSKQKQDANQMEEAGPIIHNPVSSDPALTSNPKLIEEPFGGHMNTPGQSSRQYTLSNL
ncbi:transmembrane inner ear expressed protein-like [Ptychodera flava]|uniref:transmembrane inner ear expressed protein-like n=1 Tax=Ptychodera flava TaxID=63121 RepID=UPI00396AAF7E